MTFMRLIAPPRARSAAIRTTRLAAWSMALTLTLSLTACGYKGDLTHPVAHAHPYIPIDPTAHTA